MAVKLTGLNHKVATQLRLVAESCTICSSRSSRRPVRKLLDAHSYKDQEVWNFMVTVYCSTKRGITNLNRKSTKNWNTSSRICTDYCNVRGKRQINTRTGLDVRERSWIGKVMSGCVSFFLSILLATFGLDHLLQVETRSCENTPCTERKLCFAVP
jgi:hypothetical protein